MYICTQCFEASNLPTAIFEEKLNFKCLNCTIFGARCRKNICKKKIHRREREWRENLHESRVRFGGLCLRFGVNTFKYLKIF